MSLLLLAHNSHIKWKLLSSETLKKCTMKTIPFLEWPLWASGFYLFSLKAHLVSPRCLHVSCLNFLIFLHSRMCVHTHSHIHTQTRTHALHVCMCMYEKFHQKTPTLFCFILLHVLKYIDCWSIKWILWPTYASWPTVWNTGLELNCFSLRMNLEIRYIQVGIFALLFSG